MGSAALPQGGERVRRGRALRRGNLRRFRAGGLALGLLEPFRRLGLPARHRRGRAVGIPVARLDPRLRSAGGAPGDGGQPGDLRGDGRSGLRPRLEPARGVPRALLGAAPRGPVAASCGRSRPRAGVRRVGDRADGGARPSLGAPRGVLRRRAGRGGADVARRRHDDGLHAFVLRRVVPRDALPAALRARRRGRGVARGASPPSRARCSRSSSAWESSSPRRALPGRGCGASRRSTACGTRRSGSRGAPSGWPRWRGWASTRCASRPPESAGARSSAPPPSRRSPPPRCRRFRRPCASAAAREPPRSDSWPSVSAGDRWPDRSSERRRPRGSWARSAWSCGPCRASRRRRS